MGPEPMTRILWISVRLGMGRLLFAGFHQTDKTVKQVCAVLRPRRTLRVILHAERAVFFTLHAFNRIVQNIDMRHGKLCLLEGIGINGVRVILRGDLDAAGRQIPYRMVAATMAELKLVGLCAISERQDLVSQADPEDGIFAASVGSPGPLEIMIPSGFRVQMTSEVVFQGTTVTSHPRRFSERRIFFFMPQSMRTTWKEAGD